MVFPLSAPVSSVGSTLHQVKPSYEAEQLLLSVLTAVTSLEDSEMAASKMSIQQDLSKLGFQNASLLSLDLSHYIENQGLHY